MRRRGHGAVEPGQRHHVHDGLDAGAGLADHLADGAGELDLRRGVGAVAELVLQPLEAEAVALAVADQARHQEARKPLLGLRQHQEGVRHRRRHEPFVAGQAIEAGPCPLGLCRVGAHIGAALLLGHAHAERQPGLFDRRLLRLVVFARRHARRPFAKQLWAGHQRRKRRAGHGDRAEMAAFELGRQVEARRPHLVALAGLVRAVLPDRGMQPAGDRAAHQRVIGRMKLDQVDPPALAVMGLELRRFGVGEARQVLRLRRQHEAAETVEILLDRGGEEFGELHQQRVAAPGIGAGERRRLVRHFVGHAASFSRHRTDVAIPGPFRQLI